MSSMRPVKYEVTLPGWYVYLICESLTSQNRQYTFNLSVISTFSKRGNLVVGKMMCTMWGSIRFTQIVKYTSEKALTSV